MLNINHGLPSFHVPFIKLLASIAVEGYLDPHQVPNSGVIPSYAPNQAITA